jgi:hypothetical protein
MRSIQMIKGYETVSASRRGPEAHGGEGTIVVTALGQTLARL